MALKRYQDLCLFGLYASTKQSGRNKLMSRAIKGVFLGIPYDTKGYNILNLETNTIIISRDVSFHEYTFPFSNINSFEPGYTFPITQCDIDFFDFLPSPCPINSGMSPPITEISAPIVPTRKSSRVITPPSYLQVELLHINTWGPFQTPTHDGFKYFLTIVDDYSKWSPKDLLFDCSNLSSNWWLLSSKQRYQDLCLFGLYASTKQSGRNKLMSRAIKGVFLGIPYDTKGYNILNLETNTIIISRDVSFHEYTFPFSNINSFEPGYTFPITQCDIDFFDFLPSPCPINSGMSPPITEISAPIVPTRKSSRVITPPSYLQVELLHINTWGPFQTPTHDGFKYFLTIVDDYSKVTWTHLVFKAEVKIVRSDNAKELGFSQEGTEFFASKGIIHQSSCAFTLQQNDIVERKHIYLLETTRALLFQSHLPIQFWGHCLLYATSRINRYPSKPSKNKLMSRAIKGVFLGIPYGTKGYKILNLKTNTIIISRDVSFHEYTFPFSNINSFEPGYTFQLPNVTVTSLTFYLVLVLLIVACHLLLVRYLLLFCQLADLPGLLHHLHTYKIIFAILCILTLPHILHLPYLSTTFLPLFKT
ncbi:hypothetical protein V2J09_015863 [Rumex salicifolius]